MGLLEGMARGANGAMLRGTSMRPGHLHSSAAWLCLAVYLSLNVGVSGLVLCIGKEGHVAIESRFAEDCCDDEGGASATLRIEARDACDCTDASLLQPAAGMRVSSGLVLPGTTLPLPNATAHVEAGLSCAPRGDDVRPACVSPPLLARRTIVLLV